MRKVMKMPKRHIILGKTELSKDKFIPIKNRIGFVKPEGGLWASPYTPNKEYISAWHEWCVGEDFSSGLSNNAVIIDFKEDIKFFVIDSQEDLMELFNIVGEAQDELTSIISSVWKVPNFEIAADIFDVIYLTEEGQWKTRMPFKNHEYSLYGWDCESILIMNFDCIEKWEYKKLNIVKED